MSLKSKRILILSTSYLPSLGGSELAIKNITDRIEGVEFDLVTLRSDEKMAREEKIGNVNIHRVGGGLARSLFLVPKALLPIFICTKAHSLIKKNKYDLVHSYQASQAAGAAWLLKIFGSKIPVVLTIQEGKNLKKQNWLTRFFRKLILTKTDAFTVISEYLKSFLLEAGVKRRIILIPNGVDTSEFREFSLDQRKAIRSEMGYTPDDRVIITVSRLVHKNGVEDLIKSITHLSEEYKLLIIGEGYLRPKFESLIQKLRIEDRVKMLGRIDFESLPRYLNMADVFVRPSYSEGLGTAFIEAMACKLPIIGTSVGGIPDFLRDRQNGLFCRPGDERDIADKIGRVFDVENRDLGQQGRQLAVNNYDWKVIARTMRSFYEEI